MTGANKKVYPGLQAVLAWNTMHWVRQQDKEPLLGYYKRFMVAVEHVEKVSGEMYPNKMMKDITKEEARERFLACRFLVAANDRFAGLKKKNVQMITHAMQIQIIRLRSKMHWRCYRPMR